jgi:hypothetical protein
MDNLILLTTVSTEFDMEIIKAKLNDSEIECFVQSNDPDNTLPMLDYASGIKIYVLPGDLEKATWLVTNTEDDLDDDMEVGVGD